MSKEDHNAALIACHRAGDREAMATLVAANEGLIRQQTLKAAARWGITPQHHDFDDLLQEGRIGLIRAVAKHDASKGMFTTCATPWIMQSVRRYCAARMSLIHVPEAFNNPALRKRASQMRRLCATAENKEGRSMIDLLEATPIDSGLEFRDELDLVRKVVLRLKPGYRLALLSALGEPVEDNRNAKAIATSRQDAIREMRKRLGVER